MIYTVGNLESYNEAIRRHGIENVYKVAGGYAFSDKLDAEAFIDKNNKRGEWIVWGIELDIADIKFSKSENCLVTDKDGYIIDLRSET